MVTSAITLPAKLSEIGFEIFFKKTLIIKCYSRLHSYGDYPGKRIFLNSLPDHQKRWVKGQDIGFVFCNWQEALANDSMGITGLRRYSSYFCRHDLVPVVYKMIDDLGNVIDVLFGEKRWKIYKDGILVKDMDSSAIDLILEGNSICHLLLQLSRRDAADSMSFSAFVPETLQTVEYALTRTEQGFNSNFGEKVTISSDGEQISVAYPIAENRAERVESRQPSWISNRYAFAECQELPRYQPQGHERREISDGVVQSRFREIPYTIASPSEASDVKAVALFIGGTGKYDRHGIVGKIDLGYHQLLDGLALCQIASLRYEKYSHPNVYSGMREDEIDLGVFVSEAHDCFQVLNRDNRYENVPKILIGHSFGLLVALILATKLKNVAGIVSLAGIGRSLSDTLDDQSRWVGGKLGTSKESESYVKGEREKLFNLLRDHDSWDDIALDPKFSAMRHQFNLMKSTIDEDPIRYIPQCQGWLLIAQGTQDAQVPVVDAERLHASAIIHQKKAEKWIVKGVNHLFKRTEKSDLSGFYEYADSEKKVSRAFIEALAERIFLLLEPGQERQDFQLTAH